MSRIIGNSVRTAALVLGVGIFLCGQARAQGCLGDCNDNGTVTAGELTKIIAVILQCGGTASGCAAVSGGCVPADKNGNGIISAGELTNIIFNILNFPNGCPAAGPTSTPAAPTPTATPAGGAACGDGVVDSILGEDCDDGGTCIGTMNAGAHCTSESDCPGPGGVCIEGSAIGKACTSDSDCPGSVCRKCKTFGGDGCAANCTAETDIHNTLIPGSIVKQCNGGANSGMTCVGNPDCPGASCVSIVKPGTSGSFVHDGPVIQLPLPLSGTTVTTAGKLRNGEIPIVTKADSIKLPRIAVSVLACACVRGVAAKTCGGTLFEPDGVTFSPDCTPDFTAGDSVCAGLKPCTFVNGPGNSASGIIGCEGLHGTANLTFTQDANEAPGEVPPMAPTPPINSKPPIVVLSGDGPPGSAVLLNTTAIGTVTGKCADFPTFCTDADTIDLRGAPATLPQVTGMSTAEIMNSNSSTQANRSLGPFTVNGTPFDCSKLTGATPSGSGSVLAAAFTSLNQPTTGDIVVTSNFNVQ